MVNQQEVSSIAKNDFDVSWEDNLETNSKIIPDTKLIQQNK